MARLSGFLYNKLTRKWKGFEAVFSQISDSLFRFFSLFFILVAKEKRTRSKTFQTELERACGGLNYISETDSGVTPVFGAASRSASTPDLLGAIGVSDLEDVRETDFAEFFSRLTAERDWFDAEQRKNAKRFGTLKRLLDEELNDLKVFRVGRLRVSIFVLGRGRDATVAGVKMDAIET